MPNTTTQGLWFPDDTAPVAPLEGLFSQMASSFDIALSSVEVNGAPRVDNTAGRSAKFPSPQLGDRVFRKDVGYEETYYNSSFSTSAGWYPSPGAQIGGLVTRGADGAWSATGRQATVFGNTWTSVPAGQYAVYHFGNIGGPLGGGDVYLQYNGTDFARIPMDLNGSTRNTYSLQGQTNHSGGNLAIAVDVVSTGSGTKTMSQYSSLALRYIGPRK